MHVQNDPAIGKELDGYRILDVLGRGGMGIVYQAEDVALSRRVALKMIDPGLAHDENFLRRFQAEARALARIDSPYIVRVHALRHTARGSFIVMEFVDGGTLADTITRGALPWQQALPIVKQGLLALEHAHSVGVVHRDIKPSNLMLTRDGVVKVTDFGLAKLQQNTDVTVTQGISGTLAYMSPEQVKGLQELDHRSDLYSYGMTIYEMLTGQVPFGKGGGEFETMRAIVETRVPPMDRLRPGLPAPLVRIVEKVLEKDPAARFQSAREMLEAIEAFEGTSGGAAGGAAAGTKAVRAAPRTRTYVAAAVLALLLAATGLLAYTFLLAPGGADEASVAAAPDLGPAGGAGNAAGGGADTVALPDAAPPAAPHYAALEVTSSPARAEVWVNGTRVGQTPYRSERVASGRVQVRVVKDGFQPWEQSREARAGETVNVAAALQPFAAAPAEQPPPERPAMASLQLRAVPAGAMQVDGRSVDPSAPVSVPAGRRTLTCGTPPLQADTTLTVSAGQTKAVTCYVERTVNIVAVAEDGTTPFASVWIDDRNTGQYTGSMRLAPGRYRVTVRRDGFETIDEEQTLVVRPSFEETVYRLVFHVRRAPGS